MVLINIALIGFFLLPVLGVGYEFGGIMTYPIAEGTVGGLINFGGQIFGIIGIVLGYGLGNSSEVILGEVMVFLVVGAVAAAVIKEDLKRINAEKEGEVDEKNISLRSEIY